MRRQQRMSLHVVFIRVVLFFQRILKHKEQSPKCTAHHRKAERLWKYVSTQVRHEYQSRKNEGWFQESILTHSHVISYKLTACLYLRTNCFGPCGSLLPS